LPKSLAADMNQDLPGAGAIALIQLAAARVEKLI
jgi:hypothetical protein